MNKRSAVTNVPTLDENTFAQHLRENGLLTDAQLSRVDAARQAADTQFIPAVLQLGFLMEETLYTHLALHLDIKLTQPADLDASLLETSGLSLDFLERTRLLPVADKDGVLVVAASRLDCQEEFTGMAYALDRPVAFALATPTTISVALTQARALKPRPQTKQATVTDIERLRALANEGPIIGLVNAVFDQAALAGASDVHIESTDAGGRVRFRVHGTMHTHRELTDREVTAAISRIKVMSDLNISEKRLPQDGRAQVIVRGCAVDLRVACLPTQFGESVVIRLLDRRQLVLDWDALGFDPDMAEKIRGIVDQPSGLFLVAGPTGSGKTTTLYTALSGLNSERRKIVTVEDPIEYSLPGINQVPVDRERDLSFARALRAILRQDPDVIMIGEIRDEETAAIAVRAALVGRMVLSTIHTNDGPSTVNRLLDLGVERYLLDDVFRGVLSQRLIAVPCDNCGGAGCHACDGTGRAGRTVNADLMVFGE